MHKLVFYVIFKILMKTKIKFPPQEALGFVLKLVVNAIVQKSGSQTANNWYICEGFAGSINSRGPLCTSYFSIWGVFFWCDREISLLSTQILHVGAYIIYMWLKRSLFCYVELLNKTLVLSNLMTAHAIRLRFETFSYFRNRILI